jgi:hypothetical protein
MKRQNTGEQSGQFLETKKQRSGEDDDAPEMEEEIEWDADDDNDMYLDAMGAEVCFCQPLQTIVYQSVILFSTHLDYAHLYII